MDRLELLDLPRLRRDRPDWSDRLPALYEVPSVAARPLVRRHWSFYVPTSLRDAYNIWRVKRRHRRNLEQIEIDELDEIATQVMVDDNAEALQAIWDKHAQRRLSSRFHVATRERFRLQRLAKRWDVDAPRMIDRGEVNEAAIGQVRRAVRDARWLFVERCAKTLIPVLSLLVALVALLGS